MTKNAIKYEFKDKEIMTVHNTVGFETFTKLQTKLLNYNKMLMTIGY